MSTALKATEKSKEFVIPLQNFATAFDENYKTFGVYYNGTSLVATSGFELFTLKYAQDIENKKIQQVFYQNEYYLLIYQDKTVYLYHKDCGYTALGFQFEKLYAIELPKYFQGMLLSDGKSSYFFADNGNFYTIDIPAFSCGCYFYDRLILFHGTQILFSTIGDSIAFKEHSGRIDLVDRKGDIIVCIPYGEQIYLFREKGIDVLKILGAEEDFVIQGVFDTACIAKGSVCLANNGKIYFYTQEGLYSFYNKKIEKIYMNLEEHSIFRKEMNAVWYQNCYYLQVISKVCGQSCLYAVYPENKSLAVIALDVDTISISSEHIFVIMDGQIFTREKLHVDKRTKRKITFQVSNPFVNLGILKSMKINALHDKLVTIKSKYGIQKKFLTKEQQNMLVNLRGNYFIIEIESDTIFHLNQLQVKFTALNGV